MIKLPRRQSGLPETERRKRFGLLLVSIIASFAVQGIASPARWERVIVAILLGVTLILALWVAEAKPRVFRPIAAIAVLLVIASLIAAIVGDGNGTVIQIANLLLVVLAPPAIVVGIVRTLRARNRVTIEVVFGVLCLYLLFGMFFAFLYGVIGKIDGSFFAETKNVTGPDCLYFSFTTLTTTGYGDLTAISNLGRTLAVSEALLGQIYLVTVVALIVGNLAFRRDTPTESAES